MEIKRAEIKKLKAAEYNPRIMPADERVALKRDIQKFGLVEPIIINNGTIVGGHQRVDVVKELLAEGVEIANVEKNGTGEWTIPVVEVNLTDEQEIQLNIALNKIGGRFDTVKLKDLLRSLKGDATLTGFTKGEMANLLAPIEVPEMFAFAKVHDEDEPEFTMMSFILNRREKAVIMQALGKIKDAGWSGYGSTPEEIRGGLLVELAAEFIKISKKHGD